MTTSTQTATGRPESGALWRNLATSPEFWITSFLACVVAGLVLPVRLPLGPNYWDTDIYLDAVQRIGLGQIPNIDFFTSIGPLGFYLSAGMKALFPQAQPALLANWAIVPVSLPIAALIVRDVDQRSRRLALAILVPFLFLTSLPINLHSLYPSPGFDGFGYYNRHVALLLLGDPAHRVRQSPAVPTGPSSSAAGHAPATGSVPAFRPNGPGNVEEATQTGGLFGSIVRRRPTLPQPPGCSTIGAERLNFRVRNGAGCFPFAMAAETLWS